jgi:hypothetical protein
LEETELTSGGECDQSIAPLDRVLKAAARRALLGQLQLA